MAARRKSRAASDAPEALVERELSSLPPWLPARAQQLQQRVDDGRLPHALLIRGLPGSGKRAFARWFAEGLQCHVPQQGQSCGSCPSCAQHRVFSHPDYRELAPEKAVIKVDEVRDLLVWLQLAAPAGRWRIALLDGADTMNTNAANSLLKTLEEPADRALLILVADHAARLPATIRSRCQEVLISADDHKASRSWLMQAASVDEAGADALLAQAAGAPYRALALSDPAVQAEDSLIAQAWTDLFEHKGSVGRIAGSLSDVPTSRCLSTFLRFTALALRAQANLPSGPDPAAHERVSQVSARLSTEQWFTLRDRIERLHRIDGPSFKTQTVLEGLLADIRLMLNHEGV